MIAINSGFSRCSRLFFNVFISVTFNGNPDVMGLSYHSWLEIAVALFFPLFVSYSITERAVSRGGKTIYDEADLKRNVYLLS
jgi:hypothetical protein